MNNTIFHTNSDNIHNIFTNIYIIGSFSFYTLIYLYSFNFVKYRFYSKIDKLSDTDCVICQEPIIIEEGVELIKCNHIYHKDCIDRWFEKKKTCPLCNENIIVEKRCIC